MRHGTCKHYTGVLLDSRRTCRAGVCYRKAFGAEPGIVRRLPCVQWLEMPAHGRGGTYIKPGEASIRVEVDRAGQQMVPCALYTEPTAEEVRAERRESEATYQKTLAALKVAGKWRTKPKPAADRHEVVECPVCKGRLHLSQSSYNGHVHGKCETDQCVSWME